jgi:hypothetical protein
LLLEVRKWWGRKNSKKMARKIIPIACFVLVWLLSGCQDNVSVNSVNEVKHDSVETNQSSEENKTADTAALLDKNSSTVIAYYFHRTMRCPTCLAIEANAQRVIETGFADQIADEKLMWIPFNLDEPGGEKFEKLFDISASTLVLAKVQNGNHTEYKKLEKVWEFIGNPMKFDEYVQTEVRRFLNE